MNGLEFAASVVRSVAWPAVAIAVVFALRPALNGLLGRLTRLKGAGVEAAFFDHRLQEAESNVDKTVQHEQGAPGPLRLTTPPRRPESDVRPSILLKESADAAPRASMQLAWAALEIWLNEAREVVSTNPLEVVWQDAVTSSYDLLNRVVDANFVAATTELAALRRSIDGAAVEPTEAQAASFRRSVGRLIAIGDERMGPPPLTAQELQAHDERA